MRPSLTPTKFHVYDDIRIELARHLHSDSRSYLSILTDDVFRCVLLSYMDVDGFVEIDRYGNRFTLNALGLRHSFDDQPSAVFGSRGAQWHRNGVVYKQTGCIQQQSWANEMLRYYDSNGHDLSAVCSIREYRGTYNVAGKEFAMGGGVGRSSDNYHDWAMANLMLDD